MQRSDNLSPAVPGDFHALLVPTYTQASIIRVQTAALQRFYGGAASAPLHLCCQRFRATHDVLKTLKPALRDLAAATPPLRVVGTRLEPFYSTFYARENLKCHIAVDAALTAFFEHLTQTLKDASLAPLLGEPPALVTLLTGVELGRLQVQPYPRTLFVGGRLVLSQLKAPGHYRAVASVPLGHVPQPTPAPAQAPLPW